MMILQGMQNENESDYGKAIDIVRKAAKTHNLELQGYKRVPDVAPHFNFGSSAKGGATMAIPVESI